MPFDQNPTAAFLVIGNEILSGRTADKNIHALATKMFSLGIVTREIRVVPDEETAIVEALNPLRQKYTYVFTTGGIGPTHDDITMACVATAFGVPLIEHPSARKALEDYYGAENLNPARLRMALVPEGALLIPNSLSGAPGVRLGNVFVLAGVPEIMSVMLDAAAQTLEMGAKLHVCTVRCHTPESLMAAELTAIAEAFPMLEIGSYPTLKGRELGVALVVKGVDAQAVQKAGAQIAHMVESHGDTPQVVEGF